MTTAIETFQCARQKMTLTVAGCRRLWVSAQEKRPDPGEGRHSCLSCPIGAQHGGQAPAAAAASRASEALRRFCPGCSRPASRLIHGLHCVSCYNRRREIAVGKNAKGNPPAVVAARIHDVALSVATPTSAPAVEVFQAVASRVEAMVFAAKRAAGAIHFGRPLNGLCPEGAAA